MLTWALGWKLCSKRQRWCVEITWPRYPEPHTQPHPEGAVCLSGHLLSGSLGHLRSLDLLPAALYVGMNSWWDSTPVEHIFFSLNNFPTLVICSAPDAKPLLLPGISNEANMNRHVFPRVYTCTLFPLPYIQTSLGGWFQSKVHPQFFHLH